VSFLTGIQQLQWAAIVERWKELRTAYGEVGRSAAMVDAAGTVYCRITVTESDGRIRLHLITARWKTTRVQLAEEVAWTENDAFWLAQLAEGGGIIIDGEHYRVGDGREGGIRGYDGREFRIAFFDDRETIVTTNLWHQGTVPPSFRAVLPNNATFIREGARRDIAPRVKPLPTCVRCGLYCKGLHSEHRDPSDPRGPIAVATTAAGTPVVNSWCYKCICPGYEPRLAVVTS